MREQTSEKETSTKSIADRQSRLLGPLEHDILDTLWTLGGAALVVAGVAGIFNNRR